MDSQTQPTKRPITKRRAKKPLIHNGPDGCTHVRAASNTREAAHQAVREFNLAMSKLPESAEFSREALLQAAKELRTGSRADRRAAARKLKQWQKKGGTGQRYKEEQERRP